MSDQRTTSAPRGTEIAAYAGRPASYWVACLASLAMIVGGVGPWATAFGFISVDGTRLHGWNEVALGVAGLLMLVVHWVRGARLPLIVAAGAGAIGAMQAAATVSKLGSDGTLTVLGVQYRYLDPAWGLYLVLGGGIALACAATLAWRAARTTT